MSLDLFRVYDGLDITSSDLTSNANILQGAGAPGTVQTTIDAPVGSVWLDTTSNPTDKNQVWWKHTAGAGVDKWAQGASVPFVTALTQGISWREPAKVLDKTSTTLPAGNVVDSVTVNIGERVLFSTLTTNPNVYVWNGTTWTQDTNLASNGDALLINLGSSADQQWMFEGSVWLQFGGSTIAELDHVRQFVGKDASGNTLPSYVSTDIVVDGVDLRLGISSLDNVLGTLTFGTHNVISNIDKGTIAITGSVLSTYDVTAALNAFDGAFGTGTVTNTSGFSLTSNLEWKTSGGLTLSGALNALNNSIDNLSFTSGAVTGYTLVNSPKMTVTTALDALNTVLGPLSNASDYTSGGFLSTAAIAGNTVQQTLDSTNVELGALSVLTFANSGSASVSVTTPLEPVGSQLSPSAATEVVWSVQVKDGSGNRQSFMVHYVTDGTTSDHTMYAIVRTGSSIGGSIGFDATIVSGKIQPSLTPAAGAGALTFSIKRISHSYLA